MIRKNSHSECVTKSVFLDPTISIQLARILNLVGVARKKLTLYRHDELLPASRVLKFLIRVATPFSTAPALCAMYI